MTHLSTFQSVTISCVLALFALGLIHAVSASSENSGATEKAFYDLAQKYLDETFRLFPTRGSLQGYHKYDGELEDFGPEAIPQKVSIYRNYQKEIRKVKRSRLSVSAQVDRDLLLNDVQEILFALTELKPFEKDPIFYNNILGNSTLFITQISTDSPDFPARMESLLARMKKIPLLLEQARANLNDPSALQTRFCALLNRGHIEFFHKTLPPLADRVPELKAQVGSEAAKVVSALQNYQEWLEEDLLPRSEGDWRLGKDLWTQKLKYSLSSDLSAEEIIRRAEEKLRRDREEMLVVAQPLHDRLFPAHKHEEKGDDLINVVVGETLDKLSENHSTRETLFSDVRKWIEKAKKFIRESDIISLPPAEDNFLVEPTPAFLDGVAVAFFNPAPSFEPELKKSFWVSSIPKGKTPGEDTEAAESFLREYNDYGMQSLIIHEAFPGHYVQSYYAQKSPLTTIYKKVFASGTFAEGWACLAAEEMFTNGYSDSDPANYLFHKKLSLRLPLNALLDSRFHTEPMTEEEADRWALDLLMKKGFQEEAEARGKIRRAKITSTQLSTYFVGFMELYDILQDVQSRKGDRFRLKAFNERLLSFGTIPPRDVRRLMFSLEQEKEAD